MNNDLIYFVAIDEPYCKLVEQRVAELRTGGFDGDILAITDRELAGDVTSLVLPPEHLKSISINRPNESVFLRAMLGELLPKAVYCYSYILYLDADVKIAKPIDDLLREPGVRCGIRAMQLDRPMHTIGPVLTAFDRKHPAMSSLREYSAAVVGFPGGRMADRFLTLWNYECRGRRGDDQRLLNLVILREFLKNTEPMPRCSPTIRAATSDAVLIHGHKPPRGAVPRQPCSNCGGVSAVNTTNDPNKIQEVLLEGVA